MKSIKLIFPIFFVLSIFAFSNPLNAGNLIFNHSCSYSVDSGGLVIAVQGLVEAPILFEFSGQKTNSKTSSFIDFTIFAGNGNIVYHTKTKATTADFSGLSLPAGSYSLVVEFEGAVKLVDFIKS